MRVIRMYFIHTWNCQRSGQKKSFPLLKDYVFKDKYNFKEDTNILPRNNDK